MVLVVENPVEYVSEPDSSEMALVSACFSAQLYEPLGRNASFEFGISNSSTAELFTDYFPIIESDFVVIPAGFVGSFSFCVNITVFGNDVLDGDRFAIFTLTPLSPFDMVFFPNNGSYLVLNILDNDCEFIKTH